MTVGKRQDRETSPTSENKEVPLVAMDHLHFLALDAVCQMLRDVGG